MNRLHIAQLAHEVNRAYAASLGDIFIPAWGDATEAQRASILAGVDMHIANPDATPEQSHASWLEQKTAEGWAWGEARDNEKKLHPCFLPYSELPPEQKAKDYLFRGVVHAALALPVPESISAAATPVAEAAQESAIEQQVKNGVLVRYVGREEPYTDRLYDSKLSFHPQQVRRLPGELATRFLRHSDVFKPATEDVVAVASPVVAPVLDAANVDFKGADLADVKVLGAVVGADGVPNSSTVLSAEAAAALLGQAAAPGAVVDDTAKVLELAAKDKAVEDTDTDRTQDMIDQLGGMNKDALQDFAQVHYGQKVPKNLSVENMRTRVGDMVRQYGKP